MEFLQANWVWLLLGLGAVWFLFRRGGMGCGMGEHESRGSRVTPASKETHESEHAPVFRNDPKRGESEEREAGTATPRRHRGC